MEPVRVIRRTTKTALGSARASLPELRLYRVGRFETIRPLRFSA